MAIAAGCGSEVSYLGQSLEGRCSPWNWACGTFAGRRTTRLDTVLHFVCNGLGASISKNNQLQYEHLSSNQGVGGSSPSGRAI